VTKFFALAPALALGGCLYKETKPQENLVPADYKPAILEMVHGSLEDPTNIRDASLSEPVLKPVAGTMRYVVCFRYNPRDGGGQYMGVKNLAAVFYSGRITQFINATAEQCGGVVYQPFPELQKLCRTIVCPR
jgi:hypothetical protein